MLPLYYYYYYYYHNDNNDDDDDDYYHYYYYHYYIITIIMMMMIITIIVRSVRCQLQLKGNGRVLWQLEGKFLFRFSSFPLPHLWGAADAATVSS